MGPHWGAISPISGFVGLAALLAGNKKPGRRPGFVCDSRGTLRAIPLSGKIDPVDQF
jgi:hypothetical protein